MPENLIERVRLAAEISIGRAAGFAALAIGCVVLGMSSFTLLALRTGAVLSLLAASILCLHALSARRRPFRRTEVWLLLDRPRGLSDAIAQRLIGEALQTALERYARWYVLAAAIFWLASMAWAARLSG